MRQRKIFRYDYNYYEYYVVFLKERMNVLYKYEYNTSPLSLMFQPNPDK
jgi:hypothetical protein